jgi:hypothetical protein
MFFKQLPQATVETQQPSIWDPSSPMGKQQLQHSPVIPSGKKKSSMTFQRHFKLKITLFDINKNGFTMPMS